MKLKCIFSFIDAATNTLSSCLFLYVQQVSKEIRQQSFNVDCKLMLIGGAVCCSKSGGMFLQPCVLFSVAHLISDFFFSALGWKFFTFTTWNPFFFLFKYDYDLDSRERDEKVLMCNQVYMNNWTEGITSLLMSLYAWNNWENKTLSFMCFTINIFSIFVNWCRLS